MEYPKVIVITLNWNRKEDTIECLKSLQQLDYPNFEVVVVDNGSSDGSADAIRQSFPNISLIQNDSNLGYSLGMNTGIKYAMEKQTEYVLIMNNDTVIDKTALSELVKIAEADSTIGLVTGKSYLNDKPDTLQVVGKTFNRFTGVIRNVGAGEVDRGQYDEVREYELLDDVFLLARTEVFHKAGMYDANFFLYYEETDLCARVRKAGYRLVYTPQAKIWHKGSLSTGGGTNPTNTFYNTRNHIVFMKRNVSSLQFSVFVLYLAFIQIPLRMIAHVKHKRYNCVLPYLKGALSGVGWVVKNL